MIGIVANPTEHPVVREFFELFKTPWEFYRSDRKYEVVVCAVDTNLDKEAAKVTLIYGGQKLALDSKENIEIASHSTNDRVLSHNGTRMPIYGNCITFRGTGSSDLCDEETLEPAIDLRRSGERLVGRIGYNLFAEVRTLLTMGQPVANAAMPALDLHIALLRDLIIAGGVSLIEIPPVPDGYRFIACLTHDVDHPSIRLHRLDHTMFGFLYRAMFGSLLDVMQDRMPFRNLLRNWVAAVKLPFIHMGIAKDFWLEFENYAKLEKGLRSSFFVIPFKDRPGRTGRGSAPSRRASRYGAREISEPIRALISAGCEIGLHGIDSWLDGSKAREELEEILRITGARDIGVRMHWLYFDEQSQGILDKAGADYDSTVGFNETVGYRAGTAQVYKPLDAVRLLELPLHVMDTALFYPGHMHLKPQEASKRVGAIIDNAVHFGGVITVNWHDRSIAPERLWGDFYLQLIDELKEKGAWLATASEAVAWFRKRRLMTFENGSLETNAPNGKMTANSDRQVPGLRLRVHMPGKSHQDTFINTVFAQDVRIPLNDG
jgi:peptidoglycan/xylan/chitin deacetylase (PgdA/CDA1 family)